MSAAGQWGIETEYRDAWGVLRSVPEATVARLIEVLASSAPDNGQGAFDASCDGGGRCYRPEWLDSDRLWGIAVQLYGVRSARNWGIGDFTDLRHLIALAAAEGADFVGVNPLHALFAADPRRFSPYSPSSREFLNVLYIDVTAMHAYPIVSAVRPMVEAPDFERHLADLRDAELVDYEKVANCKEKIFRLLYDGFAELARRLPNHPLAADLRRFVRERGEPLRRFAIYQALSCRPGFGPNWRAWPDAYRDPASPGVAQFAETNVSEIHYHAFLQWEADEQLAACADAARRAGMRIGLYLDLAVGTEPGSAEGWNEQHNMIRGFHVGAPPDDWNKTGQDWGLFAFNPAALDQDGGRVYRRVLGAVMRHAGAIRIDHVLGYQRVFLVADGSAAADGTYLRMPASLMCQALAEESVAYRCLVVGEDLGTVPEGFQALMTRYGLLSYRLLIFGKEGTRYLAPDEYPPDALAAITTHDLAPLRGFWSAGDLALRARLGLFTGEQMFQQAHAEREADRRAMADALAGAGCETGADLDQLAVAAHRFLARTPCRLFLVQMEDLALESDQPNLPASGDRYPNWRRKLGRGLDALFADSRAARMLAAIRAERPRLPKP
jgi:(1->4)-alpha-D-glucan 1-alpha-D-glucosylmutase